MSEERVVRIERADVIREAIAMGDRIVELLGQVDLDEDAGVQSAIADYVAVTMVQNTVELALPEELMAVAQEICDYVQKEVAPIIAEIKAGKEPSREE